MCGIAGIISQSRDISQMSNALSLMSATMERRGPDEGGMYILRNAALIHRRLSVVDTENGKQPMILKRGEETYVLVYNGELYNCDELRKDLLLEGYTFESRSDTEVLLKTYVCYKDKCPQKLNGIFAFAVYEVHSGKLFLCRDRVGVKPLFYSQIGDTLVFASQIKTILASDLLKAQVDEEGLMELFFLAPARTSGVGILRGISELLPGEYGVFERGKLRKNRYFRLTATPFEESEEETIEHTRFLIKDSIERQLVSDVPLCTFLSGGLDSSIITKVASENYKSQGKGRLHTFSVEYEDNEKYFKKSLFQPNRDFEYINMMQKDADTVHHQVILETKELFDALPDAAIHRDLPAMADVDSSLLLFSREIKKEFTVALSGECADELFGGYPWYHNKDILFEDSFPWSRSLDIRRKILKKGVLLKGEDYVRDRYKETLLLSDFLPTDSPLEKRMREMFTLNFYWFMQCLLQRKDSMTMAHGLEVRVPFCDHRIVEYAYNMPWSLKALSGREKGIVRKAFEGFLPEEIIYRKKSPYPKTHNPLYHQLVFERVKEILKKKTPLTELLSKEGITQIGENPESVKNPWYGQLMKAPQILGYIIELDAFFEYFGVTLV